MYVVANLETRCILTYRDGACILNVNKELAQSLAERAQQADGVPHAVIDYSDNISSLGRQVSPTLRRMH
jgi:hypothetical protein